ncbi:DUF2059 domain-containing protein [Mucilaginibacter sp. SP1R1]|uniref:DUF2059 domain-containing protein n=1 Tax=Mucilaginibacter sp. SP1R1 TaxID=2723091 RepID=UPI00161B047B|nr:DUF2059 domain-containing protein [Mucilaginibacter sp. SP1R1]MBB6152506.1 hypothetical protein [Mucilaginibacter sp. SP1R1]
MKLNLITLITLLLLSIGGLKAQTAVPEPSASHLKAAEQLLIATGVNNLFGGMMDKMIVTSSNQMPEEHRASYIKVMNTFIAKYFTWDTLKDRIAKLYATEFTEDELIRLSAFYNTPLGKKVSSKLPALTEKGMLIGQQAVADHRPELEQMMKDAFQNDAPPAVKEKVN